MDVLVRRTTDNPKEILTSSLLYSISDHLSSRKDCRGEMYRVEIEPHSIRFQTPIQVFPDIYHRKDWDKSPVIQHIIFEHFPDLFAGAANGCQVQIRGGELVSGIYEYRASLYNKNRRWFRVK